MLQSYCRQAACLTLICAVVENIKCFHCVFASLLIAKDEVNPLVQVTGNILRLLWGHMVC